MVESINLEDIDNEIYSYFDLNNPKSFFLFAGAGSGKTRTLVNVLNKLKSEQRRKFLVQNQKVAIITYTNAACEEIRHRLEFNTLFQVQTIHSFIWNLVSLYQDDIKEWMINKITEEILELEELHKKGKPNSKAHLDREQKIKVNKIRLENINEIKKFTYNPNNLEFTKESLNHSEVINIGADFLKKFPSMQLVLIKRFPVLLIDESQDTNKHLVDAFFEVQSNHSNNFLLGLFGDMMQRIYADGKENLGNNLPNDWKKPVKKINYRSSKRVIKLINEIRQEIDKNLQEAGPNSRDGLVRLFVVNSKNCKNKLDIENAIQLEMSKLCKDDKWHGDNSDVKILTIEHHMAALRLGFSTFFESLYKAEKLKTGLLTGDISSINFFTKIILPLVEAHKANNEFKIARLIRENSPLLETETLKKSNNQVEALKKADDYTRKLLDLWLPNHPPRLIDILNIVHDTQLFNIPSVFLPIISRNRDEQLKVEESLKIDKEELPDQENEADEISDEVIDAWDNALMVTFDQIESYNNYIKGTSRFATHQGVKGLEFPRVMVIIDDDEARGFMFNYSKLFGEQSLSTTDLKNESEGKDTGVNRTRRLFYVTCSRAEDSLAVVAYSQNPSILKDEMLSKKWFEKEEIIEI